MTKPQKRWCPACQAIPVHGYCLLAGCPNTPPEPLSGRPEAEDGTVEAGNGTNNNPSLSKPNQ